MKSQTLFLEDDLATIDFGKSVACAIELNIAQQKTGFTVFLSGTLGAGKTTMTRGVLQRFGYSGAVKSPTYTLVEPYALDGLTIYHFDLYRLGDPEELEFLGIRDYFAPGTICLIEWPCRGMGMLPLADITLSLSVLGKGRELRIEAETENGIAVQQSLVSGS